MTDDEKFLFDLNGYLCIENVLTGDEVAAANATLDKHDHLIEKIEPILSGNSQALKGQTGRGSFKGNLLTLEHPWCDPFRLMLTHPKIVDIFNEVLDEGFRLDHGPGLITADHTTEGHQLHGAMTFDESEYHHFTHGQIRCGLCVAAWILTDVHDGDGGFCCIPASHKLNYKPSMEVINCQAHTDLVKQIVCPAGSLVIFNEAMVHGALPWQARGRQRRAVLFKYGPGFIAWAGPSHECPIPDPTEDELAIFQMPHRRGRKTIPPRAD